MERLLPAVIVLLVVAGCQGNPTGPTTTESVTTDPAQAATPPDGLSQSGIEDAYDLAGVHQEALENRSFTRQTDLQIVAANGSVLVNRTRTGTWRANRSWFVFRIDLDTAPWGIYGAANGSYTAYANGTQVWVKQVYPDGSTETWRVSETGGEPPGPLPPSEFWLAKDPTVSRAIAARYQSVSPGSVARTDSGYLITAEEISASTVEFAGLPVSNISDGSFSARLTADGRVKSYEIEVTGEIQDTQVSARETMTFSQVGSAEVEEPSWFDEAVNR